MHQASGLVFMFLSRFPLAAQIQKLLDPFSYPPHYPVISALINPLYNLHFIISYTFICLLIFHYSNRCDLLMDFWILFFKIIRF